MTDIQVKYWVNEESKRHNKVTEDLGYSELAEKQRNNRVIESAQLAQAQAALQQAENGKRQADAALISAQASVRHAEAALMQARTAAEKSKSEIALNQARQQEAYASASQKSAAARLTRAQATVSEVEARIRQDNELFENKVRPMEYLMNGGLGSYLGSLTKLGSTLIAMGG